MTRPSEMAIWIILGGIIAFASLVGFVMAYSRGGGKSDADQRVPWWPDKWLRLFWLLSPFMLCVICALYFGSRGKETGGIWALFSTLFILQAVIGGMFGFNFDIVGSIVCGIFIGVEMLMLGLIILITVFDYHQYAGWYLVVGILLICAGAVFAAMLGSGRSRGRGR